VIKQAQTAAMQSVESHMMNCQPRLMTRYVCVETSKNGTEDVKRALSLLSRM